MSSLSARVAAFCRLLREEHGFRIGLAETRDALRSIDVVGVTEPRRFRAALRSVVCGRHEDLEPFERTFEAFFLQPEGAASRYARRDSKSKDGESVEAGWLRCSEEEPPSDAVTWEALLAKYSPAAGSGAPPTLGTEDAQRHRRLANALVAQVRLGRSRRWKPQERGARFDLRRTLRASLHTGADPVVLRRLGHPRRNPRFVVLVDGSRSMTEHTARVLNFAYALVRRSRPTKVFVFSTELREITRELRRRELPELGEAWGGGTRIGATLRAFVREFGALLGPETVALVFSDGLDFGEPEVLAAAACELRRRCAGLVWIAPNADEPGFAPETRGLSAVLPFVTELMGTANLERLPRIGRRLR